MYRSESEEKEMLDPGLVLTGTKCGSHHVGTIPPLMAWRTFRVSLFHLNDALWLSSHSFLMSNAFLGIFMFVRKIIS